MSAAVELVRTLRVPGPLALGAMLKILEAVANRRAPYENTALTMGLESVRMPTAGTIGVAVRVDADPNPQRYECGITIAAADGAGLFPKFEGTLGISPMRESGAELWLQGRYRVPFGKLGEAIDASILRGAAGASLERFITWLAGEIVATVDRDQRASRGSGGAAGNVMSS